jgi:branched-chain amino acid transport system ATP-binding protein
MLLEAHEVSRAFGSFMALSKADIAVGEGEIVGLIGPNGAGKSTFFNCLVGDLVPTSGRVIFAGTDVTNSSPEAHARLGIGRTFQVPATFEEMTILENVMVGAFLRHPKAPRWISRRAASARPAANASRSPASSPASRASSCSTRRSRV